MQFKAQVPLLRSCRALPIQAQRFRSAANPKSFEAHVRNATVASPRNFIRLATCRPLPKGRHRESVDMRLPEKVAFPLLQTQVPNVHFQPEVRILPNMSSFRMTFIFFKMVIAPPTSQILSDSGEQISISISAVWLNRSGTWS